MRKNASWFLTFNLKTSHKSAMWEPPQRGDNVSPARARDTEVPPTFVRQGRNGISDFLGSP